jgi:hypothetical protein
MTDDIPDNVDLKWDLREELARIDQMLRPEHDRKRQEILWYPIVVVISGRFQLNGGPAKMTDDIPDNVDLKWIARQLIELHGELCGFREGVGSGEESLRGEFNKLRQSLDNLGAVLRRVEDNLKAYIEESQARRAEMERNGR